MSRLAKRSLAFLCLGLLACATAAGQSYKTTPTGVGLGHLVNGTGNQPLRLSNDAVAIVSNGSTEGLGIPDDEIVIVTGFETGVIATSQVSLYTALGAYGDLRRSLVRLDAHTFLYVERGGAQAIPAFVVVSDAGNQNLVTIHTLAQEEGFDVDVQTPAVLDAQSLFWAAAGSDKMLGTADDVIGFAFDVGTATFVSGSAPALGAVAPEMVTISDHRGVARSLGADGIAGTADDALLVVDRVGRNIRVKAVPVGAIGPFTTARGPVLVGKDTLVYPTVGGSSLYTVVRYLGSDAPAVYGVGSPSELPILVSLVPQPVGVTRDSFVYFNAGANRVFHDADDEVRVCTLGTTVTMQTYTPGFALGLSDTSIPPAFLGAGRVVFASDGADGVAGTGDDGVLVGENMHTALPGLTMVSSGAQMVSLTGVNANAVAMQSVDSKLSFFFGLGTPAPAFSQFVTTVGCGACFVRLNDWTLLGTAQGTTDSTDLQDEIVTVQFPFIELIGTGQTCSSTGQPLAIGRDVMPVLGTTWPAVVSNGATGNPAALVLSWRAADLPLNAQAHLYLDPAFLFSSTVVTVDYKGQAQVSFYLDPLPWLPGFSFCGQWGMYDPLGFEGLCVSGGFRCHF